jgi:uncharacterized protein (DUF1778 family)
MPSTVVGLRIRDEDRAEIDRRAAEYRMSRSEYMIRAALDELPGTVTVHDRIDALDERIARLERLTFDA